MRVELKILLLANFTTSQLQESLLSQRVIYEKDYELESGAFDQIFQELISLKKVQDSVEVFIFTRAENFDSRFSFFQTTNPPNRVKNLFLDRYRDYLEQLFEIFEEGKQHTYHISGLFGLGPPKRTDAQGRLNAFSLDCELHQILNEKLLKAPHIKFFNMESCLSQLHPSERWNRSQDFLFRQPFTKLLSDYVSHQILKEVQSKSQPDIKVLALDADNTLWGGVIGEDNRDQINIGQDYPGKVFTLIQEFAKFHKENGVLLTLVTKNNISDVYDFFEYRNDMPLKLEDFALIKASWEPKSISLREISSELNILMENILFVDDSPLEIEMINAQLPEIQTLLLSDSIEERPEQIIGLEFNWVGSGLTSEDKNRTSMIQDEQLRRNDLKNLTAADVLLKLRLEMVVRKVLSRQDKDFQRALQLINKTNQFNLNGVRFSESEFVNFLEQGRVYVAHLQDKYGTYGLISVLMLRSDPVDFKISNYLISCRALGREVEKTFLFYVLNVIEKPGISKINFDYVDTGKNAQILEFFHQIGCVVSEDEVFLNLLPQNQFIENLNMRIEVNK